MGSISESNNLPKCLFCLFQIVLKFDRNVIINVIVDFIVVVETRLECQIWKLRFVEIRKWWVWIKTWWWWQDCQTWRLLNLWQWGEGGKTTWHSSLHHFTTHKHSLTQKRTHACNTDWSHSISHPSTPAHSLSLSLSLSNSFWDLVFNHKNVCLIQLSKRPSRKKIST